jgi:hypothetical protein
VKLNIEEFEELEIQHPVGPAGFDTASQPIIASFKAFVLGAITSATGAAIWAVIVWLF